MRPSGYRAPPLLHGASAEMADVGRTSVQIHRNHNSLSLNIETGGSIVWRSEPLAASLGGIAIPSHTRHGPCTRWAASRPHSLRPSPPWALLLLRHLEVAPEVLDGLHVLHHEGLQVHRPWRDLSWRPGVEGSCSQRPNQAAGWKEYPTNGLPMEPRETHLGAVGALGVKKGPGPQHHPVLEPPLQLGQLAEQSLGVGIYGL